MLSKKNILIFLHVIAFLFLENLCANRIIWYYDISSIEYILLFLFLAISIIFDIIFLYRKMSRKEPLAAGERKKLIIESVIAGQFLLVLLITVGKTEFGIVWPVWLAQVLMLVDRLGIYFWVRNAEN